jgi:hypothetical protein
MKHWKIIIVLVLATIINSCSDEADSVIPPLDEGEYSISIKYVSVMIYPGGGAVFLISLTPEYKFNGDVNISTSCDPALNCNVKNINLDKEHPVSEIEVRPADSIREGKYPISICFTHKEVTKYDTVYVNISQWGCNEEDAFNKRNEFKEFIERKYPNLSDIFVLKNTCYSTYTNILIVEHYTFLSDSYEVRLCYHVMIPPSDWSKLLIRKRLSWEPLIALSRDTKGEIVEIPVSEYPIFFGY